VQSLIVVGKKRLPRDPQGAGHLRELRQHSVAKDYVMWTVYDNKVFRDQARAIINLPVRCDATSFATYSNVQA